MARRRSTTVFAVVAVGSVGRAVVRRARAIRAVPPELRHPVLWVPFDVRNRWLLTLMRRARLPRAPIDSRVRWRRVTVPGTSPGATVTVHCYDPVGRVAPTGALLWIHGGGFIMGSAEDYHGNCAQYALEAGILVVSVEYRLAPEHPYPAGLDDCVAALRWLHAEAAALGVDAARIAVGGDSAGGGLAAALAQVATDDGSLPLRMQLLVYPMLDDRTDQPSQQSGHGQLIWNAPSNVFAWRCYLGTVPAAAPAVPARRDDLRGLPPAWIGTGTLDLFHDEDVAYATRLQAAGVACALVVVPGMYHGGDTIPTGSPMARAFTAASIAALREALA